MKIEPKSLNHFSDDILVQCPRCKQCSHLKQLTEKTGHRLVCTSCAYVKEWDLGPSQGILLPGQGPALSDFGLELWLQTTCCGETLWAYNKEHITYLAMLVGAKLRERSPHPQWGWRNASMDSRLPHWMLSSKNREIVIKALASLEEQVPKTI